MEAQTENANISGISTDMIEISTAILKLSTTAKLKNVSAGYFDNVRIHEMPQCDRRTGNITL